MDLRFNIPNLDLKTYLTSLIRAFQQTNEIVRPTFGTKGVKMGNTIQFHFVDKIDAQPSSKTPAGYIPTTTTQVTTKTLTVSPVYLGVYLDRIEQLVFPEIRGGILAELVANKARYIDGLAVGVLNTATNTIDKSTSYVSLNDIQDIVVGFAKRWINEDLYWVVTPGVFAKLMELPEFSNRDLTDQRVWGAARPRAVRWQGLTIYEYPDLPQPSAGVVDTFVYSSSRIGFASMLDEGARGPMTGVGGGVAIDWVAERNSWLISYAVMAGGLILDADTVLRVRVKDDLGW